MSRPVIGITISSYPEYQGVKLHDEYYQKIIAAGGLPLLLPPVPTPLIAEYLPLVDGLLLSGGGDIAAELYGEQPLADAQPAETARDTFELALVAAAWQAQLPMLGICRGAQTINIGLGGDIWQDISLRGGTALPHNQTESPQQTSQWLNIRDPKLAAEFGAARICINTHHHQAVRRIAEPLQAVGFADDGIIELIWAKDCSRFAVGTQWHPERLENNTIFRLLIAASKAYADKKHKYI